MSAAQKTAKAMSATLTYELDIRKLSVGNHIGGSMGAVLPCPVCCKPCCFIGTRREKGNDIERYAHSTAAYSTPTDQYSEWGNVCERRADAS